MRLNKLAPHACFPILPRVLLDCKDELDSNCLESRTGGEVLWAGEKLCSPRTPRVAVPFSIFDPKSSPRSLAAPEEPDETAAALEFPGPPLDRPAEERETSYPNFQAHGGWDGRLPSPGEVR